MDRVETAAVALERLAASIEASGPASSRALARVADLLVWVPLVHPARDDGGVDEVAAVAEQVRRGESLDRPAELRAFAAELRGGREAMFARGWGWLLRGGAES